MQRPEVIFLSEKEKKMPCLTFHLIANKQSIWSFSKVRTVLANRHHDG